MHLVLTLFFVFFVFSVFCHFESFMLGRGAVFMLDQAEQICTGRRFLETLQALVAIFMVEIRMQV